MARSFICLLLKLRSKPVAMLLLRLGVNSLIADMSIRYRSSLGLARGLLTNSDMS